MSSVELSAVDTTASVRLAEPADAGAKVSVNVRLWFGVSAVGKLSPLTEKPVPLMFASEIVTADPPVLVNVSERLELLLFCTLPKESVDDDAAKVEPALESLLEPPQLASGNRQGARFQWRSRGNRSNSDVIEKRAMGQFLKCCAGVLYRGSESATNAASALAVYSMQVSR